MEGHLSELQGDKVKGPWTGGLVANEQSGDSGHSPFSSQLKAAQRIQSTAATSAPLSERGRAAGLALVFSVRLQRKRERERE